MPDMAAADPAGAQVVSVRPRAALDRRRHAVPASGKPATGVTSHPGSWTTSHLLAGDHVDALHLPGATPVEHWYLLSGLETTTDAAAVVMLGDSLTDGRGSTTNANNRWPDRLLDRLAHLAVLNQAAGGTRLREDLLARLDRDVLALGGVAWLVVFAGINDIGTAQAGPAAHPGRLLPAFDDGDHLHITPAGYRALADAVSANLFSA